MNKCSENNFENLRLRAEKVAEDLQSAKSRLTNLHRDKQAYDRLLPDRRLELIKDETELMLKRKSLDFRRRKLRQLLDDLKNVEGEFRNMKFAYARRCDEYANCLCQCFVEEFSPLDEDVSKREIFLDKTKTKLSAELGWLQTKLNPWLEMDSEISIFAEQTLSLKAEIAGIEKIKKEQYEALRRAEMAAMCAQGSRDEVRYVPDIDETFLHLRRKIDHLREVSTETLCSTLAKEKQRLLDELDRQEHRKTEYVVEEEDVKDLKSRDFLFDLSLTEATAAPHCGSFHPPAKTPLISVEEFSQVRNNRKRPTVASARQNVTTSSTRQNVTTSYPKKYQRKRFVDLPPLDPDQTKITSYLYGNFKTE